MRPNDEPAFGVEEIYYQLYMLALGIHMAGPNLTPQTFEAGMFSYPGASGPRGYLDASGPTTTPRSTTSARSGGTPTASRRRTTSPARGCR